MFTLLVLRIAAFLVRGADAQCERHEERHHTRARDGRHNLRGEDEGWVCGDKVESLRNTHEEGAASDKKSLIPKGLEYQLPRYTSGLYDLKGPWEVRPLTSLRL